MHNAHDLFRAVCKQLHRERADREGLGRLQSAAAAATDQQLRSTASLPLFPSILLFSALRINAIMSRQLWMKSREKKMKTEDSGQGFSPVEHMQLTLSNDDGKFILLRIMSENHMYTPLYNVEDPNYGSKTTKDYLWVCLAEELNNKGVVCEGKDAKSAFKILIDGLARYHKKRILNGGEVRTYKYEQAMAFLGETPRIIRRSITNSLETMKKIREEEEAQVARHVREMVMVNEGMFPSRNPESFQGRVPQIAQIPPWAQLPSHVLASESEPIGLFGTRQMTLDEPKPTTSTFKESPAKQPRKRKCRYQSRSKILWEPKLP
ncbi:hypothetical protein WR25_18397 [Diploscapter pachys]|uniref:MADF domain-containing protein n=1 Tax=Diploscapter pachys TaxID=2018661 RepID=A0A2A2JZT6_9BILA|nr:hypothetical protein WR25_18397 [Diploscapter pachys]